MKTNLEKAKEKLYKLLNDLGVDQNSATESKFLMLLELAATTDWKYPEKNELPEPYQFVLAVLKDSPNVTSEFRYSPNLCEDSRWVCGSFGTIDGSEYYSSKQILVWCELPIFNK